MDKPAQQNDKVWRVIDILKWGEDYFQSKDFKSPKQEIEWLLCDILNYKRVDLYVQFEQPVSRDELNKLRRWIKRRIKREPIQYITGTTEFYGYKIYVNKHVLIPRPETERLVDVALQCIGDMKSARILDVGTGSGCISIGIAGENSSTAITAIDFSLNALNVAKKNALFNKIDNIKFIEMDFLNTLPSENFDVLISNPPYISKVEMDKTMVEVRDYEPKIALTDNKDGLLFYRRIANFAKTILNPKGWIILEVGIGSHPQKVKALFQKAGYNQLELIQDFNGNDRVIKIQI